MNKFREKDRLTHLGHVLQHFLTPVSHVPNHGLDLLVCLPDHAYISAEVDNELLHISELIELGTLDSRERVDPLHLGDVGCELDYT